MRLVIPGATLLLLAASMGAVFGQSNSIHSSTSGGAGIRNSKPAGFSNGTSIWRGDSATNGGSQASLGDAPMNTTYPTSSGVINTISDGPVIQEISDSPAAAQDPALQDVPAPPSTGEAQQPVGPRLQVQSNAATMPDECYERGSWCQLGEPFRLFGTTPRGTQVGGWWQSGYHTDDDGLFNVHDDRPRLHQAWLYAENKADRCCQWDVGFRFDLVYGVDGSDLQAFGNPPAGNPDGWDNDWDYGIYGWALPQAYLEVARGGHSIIGGKFFSPMGVESLMSPQNFFYSHSFSRYYIQPFSMTGGLSRFDFSPELRLINGVTTGWDTGFDQTNSGMNYIGGFEYVPCAPINVRYYVSAGNTGFRGDGWTHSLALDLMLTKKLNYILEGNLQNLDTTDQYSMVNYLLYRFNPCLAVGSRLEWFVSDRFTGRDNSTYSWNAGINFRRNANMMVRPEVRVDWGAGAVDRGEAIFATDFIFTF
jgi:hypothetical protein